MALPRDFSSLRLPEPEPGALTCAGIVLDGEAQDWIDAAAAFATPLELARAKRFRHAEDAARHLVGRALARRMLAPRAESPGWPLAVEFELSPWGKPLCPRNAHAPEAPPDFSIAHSGSRVWLAACHAGPVGIDVERVLPLPDILELAAQLHPLECADIRGAAGPERAAAFYRCWTRKEAVLKALGRGLNLPLAGFRVLASPVRTGWLASLPAEAAQAAAALRGAQAGHADPAGWTARDLDAGPEYQCSVAAAASLPLAEFFA